jgi:hypothetical protein
MLKLLNFIKIIRLAKVLEEAKRIREINLLNQKKKQMSHYIIMKSIRPVRKNSEKRNAIVYNCESNRVLLKDIENNCASSPGEEKANNELPTEEGIMQRRLRRLNSRKAIIPVDILKASNTTKNISINDVYVETCLDVASPNTARIDEAKTEYIQQKINLITDNFMLETLKTSKRGSKSDYLNTSNTRLKTISRISTSEYKLVEALAKYIHKTKTASNEEVHKTSNLEEALTERIVHKVVIMVMFLLVALPIIDDNYIMTFLYLPDNLPTVVNYCLNGLDSIFSEAVHNPIFLKALNLIIQHCTNTSDTSDNIPFLINLNFSNYHSYSQLITNYSNTNYSQYLPQMVYNYTSFENVNPYFGREGRDFQSGAINIDEGSFITYRLNVHMTYRLMSIFNIMKNIFIAVILIVSAVVFSGDIKRIVINPVNKIMSRLDSYLKGIEIIDDENEENKLNKGEVRLSLKDIMKKSKIKRLETYQLEKAMKKLISLISLSIGKPILKITSADTDTLKLNTKESGYTFNAVMLMLKIQGLDGLIEKYKERGYSIINQIYEIYHSTGLCYFGDIYNKHNIIMWKEDRKNTVINTKLYVNRVGNLSNYLEKEEDEKVIDFSLDYIVAAGLLCANMFNNRVKVELGHLQELSEICIYLYLDFGRFIGGYIGGEYKIDEIYLSSKIDHAYRILNSVHYKHTSILLFEDYYELLDTTVRNFTYPCGLYKKDGELRRLYRQVQCESDEIIPYDDVDTPPSGVEFILGHRFMVETDFLACKGNMSEFITENDDFCENVVGFRSFKITKCLTDLYGHVCMAESDLFQKVILKIKKLKVSNIGDVELKMQVINLQKTLRGTIRPSMLSI